METIDLQTRKIYFIQEFLRFANDSIVEKFESMLHQERKKHYEQQIKPMSMEEYESRIDTAFDDFKNGRMTNARKLKQDIVKWK